MTYRRLTTLVAAHMTFALCVSPAVANEWRDPAHGMYGDASNWIGGVPTSGDVAEFNHDASYTVFFDDSHQVLSARFNNNSDVTFNLDGHIFEVSDIRFGWYPSNTGSDFNQLTIKNGSLITLDDLLMNNTSEGPAELMLEGPDMLWLTDHLLIPDTGPLLVHVLDGTQLRFTNGIRIDSDYMNPIGFVVEGSATTWTTGDVEVGKTGYVALSGGAQAYVQEGMVQLDEGARFLVDGKNRGGPSASLQSDGYITVGSGLGDPPLRAVFDVLRGGAVDSGVAVIAESADSRGIVTVDGDGSTWTADSLFVGNEGVGRLDVNFRGYVSSPYTFIGVEEDSRGNVLVHGSQSTLESSDFLAVGFNGEGELEISEGGTVLSGPSIVGDLPSGNGRVVVSSGSIWTSTRDITVGAQGAGGMIIKGGSTVTSGNGTIGQSDGSTGSVSVHGGDTVWINDGDLTIAKEGAGELTITNGGFVSALNAYVGHPSGGSPPHIVTVRGMDDTGKPSQLSVAGELVVGRGADGLAGIGNMVIRGGGLVSAGSTTIGRIYDSHGTITVRGTGSKLTTAELIIGNLAASGALRILDGGLVTSSYGDIEGNDESTVTVKGTGASWLSSGAISLGSNGALNVSGGGYVESSAGYLGSSSSNARVMGADSEWKNAGDLTVENGNLRIRGGGSVVNIDGYVAKESGSYGIVTVDGNGSVWTNSSELFMNGDGVGILYVQNEAVVYVAETMYLGTGYTYHLETGGELQTGSIVTAASVARGVAASGSVSGMDQGGIISLHPGGAIQFSGGRIRADMLDLTGGGEFNWTGGLLEVARVEGSLVNQGGVLYPLRIPPEGILVRGDYFQEAAGRLLLAIRGNNTDQVDLLHVTGDAMIDGQVVMMFINGFAPRMGDQFPLVMADGLLSDEEAIYRVQNLAPGFRFDIVRDGGVVTMVALNDGVFVPEPSALLYPLISFAIPTMLRFRPKARRQFAV